MNHHTKDKGDLGVAMVIADCAKHGIHACLPISEHLPFDLIIVDQEGQLAKIQVKYITKRNDGTLPISMRNSYLNKDGPYAVLTNRELFDAYAVYCPDTEEVYYVHNCEIPKNQRSTFRIRIDPSKNNQVERIRYAKDYLNPNRLFAMM